MSTPDTQTRSARAARAGTAEPVAKAAEKPVVVGGAETPIEPGGPGAGAAKVAKVVDGAATRPQAGAVSGSVAEELARLPALTEADEAELASYEAAFDADPALRAAMGRRMQLDMYRRMRGVPAGRVVDAADVSGRRLARAAAPIKRDGVEYGPGTRREWVPVDFEGYTELVQIGAITDTPWDELERDAL